MFLGQINKEEWMLFFNAQKVNFMKSKILIMIMLVPMLTFAQIKGKKSKKPFTTSQGTEYKIGDVITLGTASNEDKFAYVYVKKSAFSIKNIAKAVKSVKDVKNMNVKNIKNISNTINKVNDLANSEIVSNAMTQLMGKAVSVDYVEKNALESTMKDSKFKIKNFKIYTDKATGEQIIHAIAKGGGKNVAILLDFAEKTGELK